MTDRIPDKSESEVPRKGDLSSKEVDLENIVEEIESEKTHTKILTTRKDP